MDTFQRKCCSP